MFLDGTPIREAFAPSATMVRRAPKVIPGPPINSAFTRSSSTTSTTALQGIPKMFRWLTDQYPDIVNRQLESSLDDLETDYFYLDMNGIIHPCTHGNADDQIIVLDEAAMFKKIFLYVDRLYKLVKPKKVLYLAVDGVAPRAKMNQQRSRRFRSAKEAEQLQAELTARSNQAGKNLSLDNKFDSNCITPGTDFMLKLSISMQKWVAWKLENDPIWKDGADVIVSGPDVPGEGEHKVMDFIREQRAKSGSYYEEDAVHILYGLDADLIMLGLVTHEPNFYLLREKMSVVMAGRGRNKYQKKKDMLEYNVNDFEVLELSSLRQMIRLQFRKFADPGMLKVPYNLDRIVDDFVFMCMLVGNDFLPHTPHLEIDSGALSLMTTTYVDLLPSWGDYLTNREAIHPLRFEEFLYHLSVYEEEHFKRRGFEENEPGWKLSADNEEEKEDFYGSFYSGQPTPECAIAANKKFSSPPESLLVPMAPTTNRSFRRLYPENVSRSYRDFYYDTKLDWEVQDRQRTLFKRREHVREFLEGLHWNLNYYHNGCQSWDWYFPYLYAPLATDMVNLSEFYDKKNCNENGYCVFEFENGTPFPSLAQLLSVLPPQSAELLPKPLGELMRHPSSPLAPYYPREFESDANGKRQPWEAVVKLPFIDADELLVTVNRIMDADKEKKLLTPAERLRNKPGKEHVFVAPGLTDSEQEKVARKTTIKKGRMPVVRKKRQTQTKNIAD